MTRAAGNATSNSTARPRREKSSIAAKTRIERPSVNASLRKSIDQQSLSRSAAGTILPVGSRGLIAALAPHGQLMLLVDPIDPLVVHSETVTTEQDREALVTEARSLRCMLQEPQLKSGNLLLLTLSTLSGPVLPRKLACATLAELEAILKMGDDSALARGAHHFFPSTDFRARLSRDRSATICFSSRFCSSSSFRRLASLTSIPPNFERQP